MNGESQNFWFITFYFFRCSRIILPLRRQAITMTRKQWMFLAVAVLLGGLSLYLNQDWFARDNIQIYHRSRPVRSGLFRRKRTPAAAGDSAINPVIFGFDRKLKLTSVKVIPLTDIETNKYPHPICHPISDSNSVP